MTHAHLKIWVCIENEKIEKWKTSSPGEFDYAGEHVFRNTKMSLFFLSQIFKIWKYFFRKSSNAIELIFFKLSNLQFWSQCHATHARCRAECSFFESTFKIIFGSPEWPRKFKNIKKLNFCHFFCHFDFSIKMHKYVSFFRSNCAQNIWSDSPQYGAHLWKAENFWRY